MIIKWKYQVTITYYFLIDWRKLVFYVLLYYKFIFCSIFVTFLTKISSFQLSGRLLTAYGYSAPEFESGSYTQQSDVFSFGVVMLELLTGRKSYDRWSIPFCNCIHFCLLLQSSWSETIFKILDLTKATYMLLGHGLVQSSFWSDGQYLNSMTLMPCRKWLIPA